MGGGVARFSVSIPQDLLESFDRFLEKLKYKRSRAVQEAIRMFMDEHAWRHRENELIYGAINILYNHETRGLEEALTDVQHSYMDVIKSALHMHIDEKNCMLIIAVKGEASRIKKMIDDIAGRKGIKRLKTVTFTT